MPNSLVLSKTTVSIERSVIHRRSPLSCQPASDKPKESLFDEYITVFIVLLLKFTNTNNEIKIVMSGHTCILPSYYFLSLSNRLSLL